MQLEGAIFHTLFLTLLFVVTGLPTLFGFLPGNSSIQFPPYLPGFMQLIASWIKPNEIIASDMPWAVAWYSDRKSLWLPAKRKTLTEFYDLQTLRSDRGRLSNDCSAMRPGHPTRRSGS